MDMVDITSIQKVKIEPGDALVIRLEYPISVETAERFKHEVQKALGMDVPVLVLDSGTELEVMRVTPKVEQTPEAYITACGEAYKVASDAGYQNWNERYRSALERRGLTLTTEPQVSDDPRCPGGLPYLAPHAYAAAAYAWPDGSAIVWKPA